MIKKIRRIYCFTTILLLMSSLTFGQNDNKVFVMVHFEAGRDTSHPLINEILFDELGYPPDSLRTNNLYFQQATWLSTVHMIETADTFNIKLTLAIQSQMAEYILRDTNKINLFNNWIDNGHEFAMHHHGVNHIDWGGYTNRFQGTSYPDDYLWLDKFQNSGLYRGNMQLSFNYLQQLATEINDSVVTGCITDTQIDKPDGIIYLTEGGENQSDLISIPDTIPIPIEPLYFLSHYQVVSVYKDGNNEIIEDDILNHQQSTQALNYVMSNINQIDDDEIMGIVYHAFDYYRFPDIYRDLFSFLSQNQVSNKSIKDLMNETSLGIDNNYGKEEVKIYPNPSKGLFTVQGNDLQFIEIVNINGRIINKSLIEDKQFNIDLSKQPKGVYIIKIVTDKGFITRKIILD